jgi:cytoskeleton protein RodZ
MTNDLDPVAPELNNSSPGKILHDARERLGFTQEYVAKELFMTLTKVKAIESDQYSRLHSDTFIRGYLRAYAQLVKVDLASLMSIYDGQAKILGLKEDFIPAKQDVSNRKIWQFAGALVGVLFLIWLLSVWFLDNRKIDYPKINLAVQNSIVNVNTSSSSIATNQPASTNASDVAVMNNDTEPVGIASSQSKTEPVASPSVGQASDILEFYFHDECWVEVSDANGDVLVTELKMKDTQLILKGQSPFDLKLGNAPAVSLKLNDEAVNLVPALGTNVLTIKVGRSSGH